MGAGAETTAGRVAAGGTAGEAIKERKNAPDTRAGREERGNADQAWCA